jgi:predicted ATP-grasp superfamily ATP-dependent carboligase
MHIFLYEWVTGGGLVDSTARLPESLLAEGSAMISALGADFAALPATEVTVLRDARLTEPSLPGCRVFEVHSSTDRREEFDRAAAEADWSLVVAPEFDGQLRAAVADVRAVGGRSLNASDEFIALTADKHRTAERLRAAGVAAPFGVVIEADDEKLPVDFEYPAVLKPLDGAGSQHTLLIDGPADEPAPYPWKRRLEHFYPGRATSVAILCGAGSCTPLPACWQRLSTDGRFTYRGGGVIREHDLADRASKLAMRALQALPPAHGYVGVDLVLGDSEDGGADAVIEINPRLTTSYVGLRAMLQENIAAMMLSAVSGGQSLRITKTDAPVEFSADGAVWLRR